ncbi:MAG: hypothetical protein AB7N76_29290 [Planctomycetota bacterium]
MSYDRRIAELEREAQAEPTPELLLELAQHYLRLDAPEDALVAYRHALELTAGVVQDLAGGHELHPLRETIVDGIKELEERVQSATLRQARLAEHAALLAALERGPLAREAHDRLLRLEVALGLPLHPEPPRCPACAGPIADHPTQEGAVRCARSGRDGDFCRHTDANNMFACPGCGLVVRAWNERLIRDLDEHEPPLLRPERVRCPHCNARVADWSHHYRRCPKARPADFPVCTLCRKRGYHRSPLHCPRCRTVVGETPCSRKRGS